MNVYSWSTDPDSNDLIDPPIRWPEGQDPKSVNDSARAMMAAIACLLRDTNGSLSASGTNTYALALNQTIGDLSRPFEVAFFVDAENTTGSPTLAVNGTQPRLILRRFGVGLGPGDLTPDTLYRAIYVPRIGAYVLISPEIASPGTIRPQAGPAVEPGWLPCDGRTLSRTTYDALFFRIGGFYGADDAAGTFKIPDLRGRTLFGVDGGANGSANRLTGAGGLGGGLGNSGGSETVTLAPGQMPSHSHTGTAQAGGGTGASTTGPAGDHDHGGQVGAAGAHGHGVTIDSGGAHGHSGTANTAGGEARKFSFAAGGLTPGGAAQYVADINAENVFENKRQTSGDPGHQHSVSIPSGGEHAHTGSVTQANDHQHGISGSGTHTHPVPAVPAHTHILSIDSAGNDQAHSNVPPGLVVQFVIKT
ncbi:phage tail protein [Methylobacterium aquaticum]|uniref:phage tail protein n=1 Tax=Methylobacterium aquaticum TaxID=270351 RepID=UPI001931CCEC|nr:phage tail protein [Methylobacterium aquaticum]QRE76478.1 tail fiber protein [Methylobacterium aquaticum]